MAKITFIVEGMTCGHCKAAVENTLGQLKGVTSASVDLAAKEVAVEYDEHTVGTAEFKEAIEDAGYDVKGI